LITKVESNTRGWLTCADYTLDVQKYARMHESAKEKETASFELGEE